MWQAFNEHLVAMYGLPSVLVTDNGGEFTHKEFREWLRESGVEHHLTSPYNPQADGACEKFNGTRQKILLKFTGGEPRKWTHFLPEALYAYRTAPGPMGPSPYQAVYGQNPRLPRSQGGHGTPEDRIKALHEVRHFLYQQREHKKDKRVQNSPSNVRRYKPKDFVSLRVLAPKKGQSTWAPGYQVLSEYQGGLRLVEISTGRVFRVNQRRVRNLPVQQNYHQVDPLPPKAKHTIRDVPAEAIPIPVEDNPHIPISPASSLKPSPQLFDDTDWSAWLDFVHLISTS